MNKVEVRSRIEEIGIIPAVRVTTAELAQFAVESVNRAGIPIAEVTMTVPNAIDVISRLAKSLPEVIVPELCSTGRRRNVVWMPGRGS